MNPNTGELARWPELDDEKRAAFKPVPSFFEALARRKIDAAEKAGGSAAVNMRSQHPLAKWGRDQVKKAKRKAKIAAASRRRNRK